MTVLWQQMSVKDREHVVQFNTYVQVHLHFIIKAKGRYSTML